MYWRINKLRERDGVWDDIRGNGNYVCGTGRERKNMGTGLERDRESILVQNSNTKEGKIGGSRLCLDADTATVPLYMNSQNCANFREDL